jgi:hypothetical protein
MFNIYHTIGVHGMLRTVVEAALTNIRSDQRVIRNCRQEPWLVAFTSESLER